MLMEASQIDEGDLVFAFRRGIDLLRQVATSRQKMLICATNSECIARMDRDQVSVML